MNNTYISYLRNPETSKQMGVLMDLLNKCMEEGVI